jgi:uncharacterized protein DUF3995
MSIAVSVLTFLPVLVVAFAHLLWALGTSWPLSSEQLLAQTVVGARGITRMPNRLVTLVVAILLFAVALSAMALADPQSGGTTRTLVGAVFALVFLGRGVLGYTAWWRERFPTEPFATLDRKNYSPLCLWIGAGFLILVLMRLL